VSQHDPKVVVFDLVPPLDDHWRYLQHLRKNAAFAGRRFVITTANAARMRGLKEFNEAAIELALRDDVDAVIQSVREASKAREL
jgi:hypothetical protein